MAATTGQTAKKGPRKKVLVVDDHPIVRDGLSALINEERDLAVCGQAQDAASTLQVIPLTRPDVVILDITLKDSDGIELTKDLRVRYPDLPIIVLSMHRESVYAERALRAGARAYIEKAVLSEKIVDVIRTVLRGDIYVSDEVARRFLQKIAGSKADTADSVVDSLSDRELEVLRLIGQGVRTAQMASRLHVSPKTIETYRARIKKKLGLADASDLLQYAIQWQASEDR